MNACLSKNLITQQVERNLNSSDKSTQCGGIYCPVLLCFPFMGLCHPCPQFCYDEGEDAIDGNLQPHGVVFTLYVAEQCAHTAHAHETAYAESTGEEA